MGIRRLSTASFSGGVKSSKFWDQSSIVSDMELIQTVTVPSGGQTNISFTSIPSTYKHLQLRYTVRSDRASATNDSFKVTFNSDTSSNYAWHRIYGDGTDKYADSSINQTYIYGGQITASSSTFGIFATGVMDILDYTSTNKNKTVKMLEGHDQNGSGLIMFNSGLWFKTPEAITTITFAPVLGTNFVANSQAKLYGIKGLS